MTIEGPVSLCLDKDTGTLLKHGSSERVRGWAAVAGAAFLEAGHAHMANALIVMEGHFDVEDLNRLISCTGYGFTFMKKHGVTLPSARA